MLSYLVLIPLIKFFGERLTGPLAPGSVPIKDMGPDEIRGAYILYIGAGAVAAGGIISLLRSVADRSGAASAPACAISARRRGERAAPMACARIGTSR